MARLISTPFSSAMLALVLQGAWAQEPEGAALDGYAIQPGDVLNISVWKEPDLQREVLVRPDGGISFPLAGDVMAVGLTVEDLRLEVSERLSQYIPDLVVTITVQQILGNKIYVIGQVNRPGEFIMNPRVDVLQALSMAGGMTPFASLNDIRILRRGIDGRQQALQFNYSEVVRGRNLEQNRLLIRGDVVVVP